MSDRERDELLEAEKQWENFQEKNNFEYLDDIKVCETCKFIDFGYEGERECQHPERTEEHLYTWSVSYVGNISVCNKWEVGE